jgi:glyoxylate/hydroxypyruvate reductase A
VTLLLNLSWDSKPWVERFRRLLPKHRIVTVGESFDRGEIRYAAVWSPKPGTLDDLPNLELLFSLGAGVDHLMGYPGLPDVPIVRVAQDDLTHRMSEYVLLHCLMYLRDQRRFDRQQRQKVWKTEQDPPTAREVRVGIMGFGVLGEDAARKLKLIGFDVAAWSRTPKQADGMQVFSGGELEAFLERTDILVSLLPLTAETRGILRRELFRKLARDGRLGGPILINAGRGGLQVEADILACLDDGTLKAATLDVFEKEPLPEDSPLWTHPNATITPHNSATSEPTMTARYVAEQILAYEAGAKPRAVVDKARGY